MSNTQDQQISRAAARASAGQFGPAVDRGQLALQLYVAAVAGDVPTPRSSVNTASSVPTGADRSWSLSEAAVSSAMTTNVVTVAEEESFANIMRALAEHGISAVPVVDRRNVVVGVVSEADLLAEVASRNDPLQQQRTNAPAGDGPRTGARSSTAHHLMTSPAVTVRPEESLLGAAKLAAKARVKRLPVVDSTGAPVGIISRADLVTAILRHQSAAVRSNHLPSQQLNRK